MIHKKESYAKKSCLLSKHAGTVFGQGGQQKQKGTECHRREKRADKWDGEGAPEVLLCLCGKHGDCTDEIFSENCQRMANRLIFFSTSDGECHWGL